MTLLREEGRELRRYFAATTISAAIALAMISMPLQIQNQTWCAPYRPWYPRIDAAVLFARTTSSLFLAIGLGALFSESFFQTVLGWRLISMDLQRLPEHQNRSHYRDPATGVPIAQATLRAILKEAAGRVLLLWLPSVTTAMTIGVILFFSYCRCCPIYDGANSKHITPFFERSLALIWQWAANYELSSRLSMPVLGDYSGLTSFASLVMSVVCGVTLKSEASSRRMIAVPALMICIACLAFHTVILVSAPFSNILTDSPDSLLPASDRFTLVGLFPSIAIMTCAGPTLHRLRSIWNNSKNQSNSPCTTQRETQ